MILADGREINRLSGVVEVASDDPALDFMEPAE